jgi:exosortase F-associated protein
MNKNALRWTIGILSVIGLLVTFLFQRVDVASFLGAEDKALRFIINRSIRFLLNDAFAIGLIFALFHQKKYVVFSLWVQAIGVIVFLIPYFVLKIQFPSYNGPLISYLHRLILNPTLLLLLIPAFYYQKRREGMLP